MGATDKYNLDVVVITDGVGTATPSHFPALDVLGAATSKMMKSAEVVSFLNEHGDDPKYVLPAVDESSESTTPAGPAEAAVPAASVSEYELAPVTESKNPRLVAAAVPAASATVSLNVLLASVGLSAVAFFGLGTYVATQRRQNRVNDNLLPYGPVTP